MAEQRAMGGLMHAGSIQDPVRGSYVTVMNPKTRTSKNVKLDKEGKPLPPGEEYSALILVSAAQTKSAWFKALYDAFIETRNKAFPNPKDRVGLKNPFHKMEEKSYDDNDGKAIFPEGMEPGGTYFTVRCDPKIHKPGVVDKYGKKITDAAQVYSGAYYVFAIKPRSYNMEGKGVSFALQHVMKVKDGPSLGGAVPLEQAFTSLKPEEVEGSADEAFGNAEAEAADDDSAFTL